MKLTQLLERLEYEVVQGDDQIEVTELINDSRKVSEGSVFVCISGAVSDGHTYIEQVAEKWCSSCHCRKGCRSTGRTDSNQSKGYPLCAGNDISSIFRISGRKT